MIQLWKTIAGFNGHYQVSNFGNVRSIDRTVYNEGCKAYQNKKGKLLNFNKDRGGYRYVTLYYKGNGMRERQSLKIHRLVALAFCEGYQDGLHVNHIDGDRENNVHTNLEWCTASHNARHKYILGYTNPSGQDSHSSKLKSEWIPIIKSLAKSGVPQAIIGNAFNVSQGTIRNLLIGETYKKESTPALLSPYLQFNNP